MYAQNTKYFYLITLLVILVWCHSAESHSNGRYSRRRPSVGNARTTAEDATEKSHAAAEQVQHAAAPPQKNLQRRVSAYSNDGENYPHGNLEINLIRPESEPVHTQITAKYTTSLSAARPYDSLEDAETAEEYVAKAMKLRRFGTRLREPLRIVSTESAAIQSSSHAVAAQTNDESGDDGEDAAQANNKYEYYNVAARQQQQQPQQQQQQQQQQEQQVQQEQQQETQQFVGNRQAIMGAQIRAQLQAQIQQAQIEQAQQQVENQQQFEQQTERGQALAAVNLPNSDSAQQSAPNYGREPPVTRSYEVYDESMSAYDANGGGNGGAGAGANALIAATTTENDGVDRHYRTKYLFNPATESEQVRLSSSTEIPKAEIMKQIEKSVMKYMKELEAEGKIVTAPQEAPQKSYYKMITTVPTEEKYTTSTTIRPKYPSTTPALNALYAADGNNGASTTHATHRTPTQGSATGYTSASRHHLPKQHGSKSAQRYQTEAETSYRTSAGGAVHQSQDNGDAIAPNVEFVYKIKTRAPLQTATVKTVSKPYTLPLKGTYDQFDHTAVLKNLEDFDLTHAVSTQEPDERPSGGATGNNPSKLYFNSEIYHDINSLPLKSEKSRTLAAEAAAEYRKLKSAANGGGEMSSDYKGYSGYFAEPAQPADSTADEKETSNIASAQVSEDGYPIMNPYQYVLKKEPLPSKYEEASSSWLEAQSKPIYIPLTAAAQKGLEYDSYSPKFNNNPEGYGYQHAYKPERERGEREREREREPQHGVHKYGRLSNSSGGKRGKRGGGIPYPNVSKKGLRGAHVKDIEANLALRPPPKN